MAFTGTLEKCKRTLRSCQMLCMETYQILWNLMETFRSRFLDNFRQWKYVTMVPSFNQSVQQTKPILKVPVIELNCHKKINFHLTGIWKWLLSFIFKLDIIHIPWKNLLISRIFHEFSTHLRETLTEKLKERIKFLIKIRDITF